MSLSLIATAVAGVLAGALLVRPLAFHYTAPQGHRLPRRGCPHCDHPLEATRPRDLHAIGLIQHCPSCTHRIGPSPLLPEALTGLGVTTVLATSSGPWVTAAQLWLTVIGAALVITDASVRRLPDHLVTTAAGGVALFLGTAAATGSPGSLPRAAAAATAAVGGFALLFLVRGVGLGDVKLAPVLAAVLGWHSWAAVLGGFTAGALLCAVTSPLTSDKQQRRIAFGPALIIGTLAICSTTPWAPPCCSPR